MIGKLLKAEKWWNDKAPPVLGLAYFLLATGDVVIPIGRTLFAMLAFIIAFVGVAGFGHVVNDLCDIEHDRAAGKHNTMARRTRAERAKILLILLAAAWLPWLVLPANRWNLSLIGVQLLLLTAYAVPPLRLKSRAIPGIITDALYAYTVPALITWTTWGPMAGQTAQRPLLLAALIAWSACAGLRGILNHQYLDAANDATSGVTTFATRYGRERTLFMLTRFVLPAEIVCFAALTAAFSFDLRLYALAVLLFVWWRAFQLSYQQHETLGVPWRIAPERFVKLYGYEFLGEFYTSWFPVFMLAALCIRSPMYLGLAFAHLALFRNGLVDIVKYDIAYIPAGIVRLAKRHV